MTRGDVIDWARRLSAIFAAAALATFLLFVVMLALIATSFDPPKEKVRSTVLAFEDMDVALPEIRAKISKTQLVSLLNPIQPPPAMNTKAVAQSRLFEITPAVTLINAPSNTLKPAPIIQSFTPNLDLSPIGGLSEKVSTPSGQVNQRQCTLVAHIGPGERDILGIETMNCIHADVADAAEIALKNWIRSGAKSFTDLGARAGDAVEFTYEEKRKSSSS